MRSANSREKDNNIIVTREIEKGVERTLGLHLGSAQGDHPRATVVGCWRRQSSDPTRSDSESANYAT